MTSFLVFLVAVVALCGADGDGGLQKDSKYEKCTPPTPEENNELPMPSYKEILEDSYTMVIEMVDLIANQTLYVKEARSRETIHDKKANMGALFIQNNQSLNKVWYYPDDGTFIENWGDGVCRDTGTGEPSFLPWGWFDQIPDHGELLYGPSALLRLAAFINKRAVGDGEGDIQINGIMVDRWMACEAEGEVDIFYSLSQDKWAMPDAPMFTPDLKGIMPVQIEVNHRDGSQRWLYSFLDFQPGMNEHVSEHMLEPPRGESCEGMVSVIKDMPLPQIEPHFTMRQEMLMVKNERLHLDSTTLTYAEELSLVRHDIKPEKPDETELKSTDQLKIIHDFNTGVGYVIDQVYGNCTITWIRDTFFDSHFNGLLGTGGIMVGAQDLFHLDEKFAYASHSSARGFHTDRWVSTRDDIPDFANGGVQNFGKAVLEWNFAMGMETIGDMSSTVYTPYRGELFIYNNKSDSTEITDQMGLNIYDFSAVKLYTEDEFTVSECYARGTWDWSFLEIVFPTNYGQLQAVRQHPDQFRHELFAHLIKTAQISPVRIANIDVSEGVAGPGGNFSAMNVVLTNVRLLERAPYIFSYSRPGDEADQRPGENEMGVTDIKYVEDCAKICSMSEGLKCKSFHFCDDNICFLSGLPTADGKPVETVDKCEHWIFALENETFADTPTNEVNGLVLSAIRNDEFQWKMSWASNDGENVYETTLSASESLHYRTPDPEDVIKNQFTFKTSQGVITIPDYVVENVSSTSKCLELCVSWQDFRCLTVSYMRKQHKCQLSSWSWLDLKNNGTLLRPFSDCLLFSRHYLTEYSPIFGGVAINSTGGIEYNNVVALEDCAQHCSEETKIKCRSFEWCHMDNVCHLHKETYLEVADGDIETDTGCIHFYQKGDMSFSPYSHQGTSFKEHTLVALNTDSTTCAKLCLSALGSPVCESYDHCERCRSQETGVCGVENINGTGLCFLNTKHVGEQGFKFISAPMCTHYSRDMFGNLDYPAWIRSQQGAGDKQYTPGSMTGLAFGMIFLGILVAVASIFALNKLRPSMAQEFSMTFKNTKGDSSI